MNYSCEPHQIDRNKFEQLKKFKANYSIPNHEVIAIYLADTTMADRARSVYFEDYLDLNNKTILGFSVISSTSQTYYVKGNVVYLVCTNAQISNCSLFLFDNAKNAFAVDGLPLGSLVSPATVTNMKFPFQRMNVKADMRKSYVRLNNATGFVSRNNYVVLLNVYFK